MEVFFRTPKSIDSLEAQLGRSGPLPSLLDLRRRVPIAAIDDQPFAAGDNLRHNGYKITHLRDISSIDDVKDYAIVLCDIQGVGLQINEQRQGAFIIRETKTHFPEKKVIAYSAAAGSMSLVKSARESADYYLKKDAEIEEWTEILDKFIREVTNPIIMWKEFRKRLLDAGLPPIDLARTEDAFVRSFGTSAEEITEVLRPKIASWNVSDDLRAIAQGFISSIIFKLLVG